MAAATALLTTSATGLIAAPRLEAGNKRLGEAHTVRDTFGAHIASAGWRVLGAGGGEPYRLVVDESSFDFRGLTEERLTGLLNDFSDTLDDSWWHARHRHHVACLAFASMDLRGWQPVSAADAATGEPVPEDVFFLVENSSLAEFWRSLFAREDVDEPDFFDRAREAFPELLFADSLSFRKFDGTYLEMRDWVVRVLSVVHDHFADALVAHSGQPRDVQAALGCFGLDLSPESPNTRSKPRIMKQRDVEYDGESYRCEWHGKKERHRNRVHFRLPDPRLGGRILIGIFVDHLDT